MYINKAMVVGNLVRDPELKSLPSGQKVCSFSVATNRTWKDAQGQKQEAVDYHNIACFGKQAEIVAQWMKKGSNIFVEGRMTTRSWDDKDTGKKMYRTEIIAENVQFGPKASGGGGGDYAKPAQSGSSATSSKPEAANEKVQLDDNLGTIDYGDSINPEDIPF
jgi:single-strand DNA-binding protein